MKSVMKFFVGALAVFTLVFTSCTKESTEVQDAPKALTEQNIRALIQQHMDPNVAYTVEHATLEEINKAMIENGLEPFTPEDVERSAQLRNGVWDCATWAFLGDWNDSGTFTTLDLIQAQRYICDQVGCSGTVNTTGFPLDDERFFGYMSFLLNQTATLELNEDDVDIARQFVLGAIVCNP
ncbi:MAG: hypothetical protein AAF990_09300 [Bacteroidota bacterium]